MGGMRPFPRFMPPFFVDASILVVAAIALLFAIEFILFPSNDRQTLDWDVRRAVNRRIDVLGREQMEEWRRQGIDTDQKADD